MVKNVITECLNLLLIEKNVQGAVDHAKQTIQDLLEDKVDLALLVISKSYAKKREDYKSQNQAHLTLVDKMRKRDPSTAPNVGDRVPYVVVAGAKGAPAYTKVEDPLYCLENNIAIDVKYYLENQLQQPLMRLFEPILGESVDRVLFHGEHVRSVKHVVITAGALSKFVVKQKTCLGCKVVLHKDQETVCEHCESDKPNILMNLTDKLRTYERVFSEAWATCQRCQGSLHQEVLCSNDICPLYFRRKKVQKDLAEAQSALDRFDF